MVDSSVAAVVGDSTRVEDFTEVSGNVRFEDAAYSLEAMNSALYSASDVPAVLRLGDSEMVYIGTIAAHLLQLMECLKKGHNCPPLPSAPSSTQDIIRELYRDVRKIQHGLEIDQNTVMVPPLRQPNPVLMPMLQQ